MRTLVCSCKECFKSWLQWKQIVSILQSYPSVCRAVFSLRSIDPYIFHRSIILESYIAKVIQLESAEWGDRRTFYMTDSAYWSFDLFSFQAGHCWCWMLELLDAWAGYIFPQQGNIPFRAFQPRQCGMSMQVSRSIFPFLSHLIVSTSLLMNIKSTLTTPFLLCPLVPLLVGRKNEVRAFPGREGWGVGIALH